MAPPKFILFLSFSYSLSLLPFSSSRLFANSLLPLHQSHSIFSGVSAEIYEVKYFTQTLDHFNFLPESYGTFQQKYLINDTHWGGIEKASPIFVYTGNEGNIEWFARNTGFMFDVAPQFEALLVFIEHRYYGDSIPSGGKNVAYSNATNLGHLSSMQALADYASLIVDLKKNLSAQRSPVLVFGGSYGGMLAAWFRLKYPHVALGALASSAPILQFDDIISPYAFNDIITSDYRNESESCYKTIKDSWNEIEDAYDRPGGLDELETSFKICKGQIQSRGLESWIQTALVYVAMTDYPTYSNFLQPLPPYPLKQMCKAIDDPKHGKTTFARLYDAMNIYYNYSGTQTCFNLSDSVFHGIEEWYWQACTEMVMPTQASREESIFPPSIYDHNKEASNCHSEYGVWPRPHWITTEFGGHNIKRVLKRFGSNIIFFNGLRDPWSAGGVLESLSDTLVAIVAPQGAHHVDLRFATKEDPEWLKDVREKEIHIVRKWLREYYSELKAV